MATCQALGGIISLVLLKPVGRNPRPTPPRPFGVSASHVPVRLVRSLLDCWPVALGRVTYRKCRPNEDRHPGEWVHGHADNHHPSEPRNGFRELNPDLLTVHTWQARLGTCTLVGAT